MIRLNASMSCLYSAVPALLLIIMLFPAGTQASGANAYEEVVSAGAKTYYRFCSVCHGRNAKGEGSYSENLKVTPPKLTALAADNNGTFPWIQLYEVIDGKDIAKAHGSKEMPIWGDMFDLNQWSSSNIGNANTIVRGRIFELLVYLNSIQEKADK